jgi:hypothetical protein
MDASTERMSKEEFIQLYYSVCGKITAPTTAGELSAMQSILLTLAVQMGLTFFKDTPDALDQYDIKMQSLLRLILMTVKSTTSVSEDHSSSEPAPTT